MLKTLYIALLLLQLTYIR